MLTLSYVVHHSLLLSSLQMDRKFSVPLMKEYVLTEKLGCGTFATVYKAYKKVKLMITNLHDIRVSYSYGGVPWDSPLPSVIPIQNRGLYVMYMY